MVKRRSACFAAVALVVVLMAGPVTGRCVTMDSVLGVGNAPVACLTHDTLQTDTLREVVVKADSGIHIPLSGSLIKDAHRKDYSPNAILQRLAPTLHDQIMHPFGFKERKQNRKRKKVNKILRDYDMINSDPLQMLLDSIAKAQGYEQNR